MIGLSIEEFYFLDPCQYTRLCGMYLEQNGQPNPYEVKYRDEL